MRAHLILMVCINTWESAETNSICRWKWRLNYWWSTYLKYWLHNAMKNFLERPRPDRGFNITNIFGGFLHLNCNSGGVSVGSNSEEACFSEETKGWGKQLTKHCWSANPPTHWTASSMVEAKKRKSLRLLRGLMKQERPHEPFLMDKNVL